NVDYRRVLCSLPSYLMWDDHDITDGWGSREDSFPSDKSTEFKCEWNHLFESARDMFQIMQSSRNPDSATGLSSFDFYFKVGRAGFVVPDLRSNRNVHLPRVWLPGQIKALKDWVDQNREGLDALFFVSSVVFSHGAPRLDN